MICLMYSLLLGIFFITGCLRAGSDTEYSRTESLMNTFVQVKATATGISRARLKKAVDGALDKARELEEKFNVFDSRSEVNVLNIARTAKVSPELFDLLEDARRISQITGGEFDITVAPVLNADGFYKDMPAELRSKIPDRFSGMNWKNVILMPSDKNVALRNGTWIDLSGIAKGYIVDQMSVFLRENGITAFLINAGGDIYCGTKDKGNIWRIGVRDPMTGLFRKGIRGNIIVTLGVKDMAVATSGDYENVVIDRVTGEALSHIVNPSIDRVRKEVPSSVTVIAPTCTVADALATGMMAMGRERAIALADTLKDVEIIVVECPGDRQAVSFSRGAAKYVIER